MRAAPYDFTLRVRSQRTYDEKTITFGGFEHEQQQQHRVGRFVAVTECNE